jgi:hypothetical protein
MAQLCTHGVAQLAVGMTGMPKLVHHMLHYCHVGMHVMLENGLKMLKSSNQVAETCTQHRKPPHVSKSSKWAGMVASTRAQFSHHHYHHSDERQKLLQ